MIGDGVGNPLELLIIVRRLVHDVLVLQPLEDGPLDRYPGVIGHVRHYRSRRRGRPELPQTVWKAGARTYKREMVRS